MIFRSRVIEYYSVYSTERLTFTSPNLNKPSPFLQHCITLTRACICHCSRNNTNLPGAEGNPSLCVYASQGISYILRKYEESPSCGSFPWWKLNHGCIMWPCSHGALYGSHTLKIAGVSRGHEVPHYDSATSPDDSTCWR